MTLCPCCSGIHYDHCCKLFHEGAPLQNAVQLMRSRYSAYVLNIPDYIIKTTHLGSPDYSKNKFSWKRKISEFSRNTTFHRLEVLDSKEKNNVATVTFTVYMLQDGADATFTETSFFEKMNHQWLYRGGELTEGYAPHVVTKGELKLLPLAYYGDPVLRKKAEPITEITDDVRQLAEEMIETMGACYGMGLAAPQVHRSLRLFVVESEAGEIKVFINPKLSKPSAETWKESEGCLSILTIRGLVERPKEITVEYTTLDGNVVEERFSGWEARAVLHENDHLDGILYVDRLDPDERSKIAPILQELEEIKGT